MDDRVPVAVGGATRRRPDDLVVGLAELATPSGRHAAGCACCAGVDALTTRLRAAFQARMRGREAFDRVLVLGGPADLPRVAAAVQDGSLAAARFRFVGLDAASPAAD